MTNKNRKGVEISSFEVLDVGTLLRAEAFFETDVLNEGLVISELHAIWDPKNINVFW